MSSASMVVRFANVDGSELDGDLALPASASLGVVIAHPHPQMGGNRFNPVVGALYDSLLAAGVAVLRFDFRGVGRSDGSYDDGAGEQDDVIAALDAMADARPELSLALAGYSFGADMVLSVEDPRPVGVFAVAPPLQIGGAERFATRADDRPVQIASGTDDSFRNAGAAQVVVSGWPNATVHAIDGADHFFANHTNEVGRLAAEWATSL